VAHGHAEQRSVLAESMAFSCWAAKLQSLCRIVLFLLMMLLLMMMMVMVMMVMIVMVMMMV